MTTQTKQRHLFTGLAAAIALSSLAITPALADSRHNNGYQQNYQHGYQQSYKPSQPYNAQSSIKHNKVKYSKGNGRHKGSKHTTKGNNGKQHYAQVVAVDPILQSVSYQVPQQQCWSERVAYQVPVKSHRSATPTLLGTIIGAAIGSNLGKGNHSDGRTAKTIAGGLLGASIGRDYSVRNQPQARTQYRNEERCNTTYQSRSEQQVTGYDVSYRFRGETYRTRMDYDPGDTILVNVQVRPVI
ncbi:MAG: glycine zipper 2TM domain-containing protein [Motiliproteus sp.]